MDTAVALIIFRRPELTARVFERIREARPPKLFVIADGPRPGNAEDARLCADTRAAVEDVDWPCEVFREFADVNLGLKRRIPSGLDRVFGEVTEAIILEDDCLPDPSFFPYCEELLERYRDDERVIHISGSQLLPDPPKDWSYHFSRGPAVWGWATWRRAWELYDAEMTDWHALSRRERKARLREMFEEESEQRYWGFVWDTSAGSDNWDAQWTYTALNRGVFAINPNRNLISNIGFGEEATIAKADPLGVSECPLEGIEFPLEHPPEVARDVEADRAASQLFRRPRRERLRRGIYRVMEAAGNSLEYLPEPIRPKIRHRDRVGEPDSN